jgi:hypothetical protein
VTQNQSHNDAAACPVGHTYMIVDMGGLTVDIAVHRVVDEDGRVDEVIAPSGYV